jgi:large subunit ribosomal protein L21
MAPSWVEGWAVGWNEKDIVLAKKQVWPGFSWLGAAVIERVAGRAETRARFTSGPYLEGALPGKKLTAISDLRIVADFLRAQGVEFVIALGAKRMYAVIKTGGKQYKVVVGQKLNVEQIPADIDSQIVLEEVLMIAEGDQVSIGAPLVAGAKVTATVVSHGRGEKVSIFKMRRRKHYQKHQGHRQNFTELRIDAISK